MRWQNYLYYESDPYKAIQRFVSYHNKIKVSTTSLNWTNCPVQTKGIV